MRIPDRVKSILLKGAAVIIAVLLFFSALTCCFTASILVVDVVKTRSPTKYEQMQSKIMDLLRPPYHFLFSKDAAPVNYPEELEKMRDRQLDVEQTLLAELESGIYDFTAPLVVNDPYGVSPLSAVALFRTEQPMNLSIHIAGDTRLADVDYTFDGYRTEHILPVYGLYAGRVNAVTLTAVGQDGSRSVNTLEIQTDKLPETLSHETVRACALREDAVQPGFTFTFRGNNAAICRSALDVNGSFRWYLNLWGEENVLQHVGYCGNYNGGSSFFIPLGNENGYREPAVIVEMNFLGKLLNAWRIDFGVHHDIDVQDDVLWITCNDRDSVADLLCAVSRETGEIVNVLDYRGILQPTRNQIQRCDEYDDKDKYYYTVTDWCHMNSVAMHGENLVVSCRNQSTVLCTNQEGGIQWMLCDPMDYFSYFQQFILKPVGENFTYFYTQHAADVLPDMDGNPDTVDILLFDNGDFRKPNAERASRMVQYRIDEKAMTVEQIWSWGDGINELYSYRHGDADLLANGNRLGSFEASDSKENQRYAYGVEVDPEGNVVWELWRYSNDAPYQYDEYRLERLMIYAQSANDLRLGVPANLYMKDSAERTS